MKSILVTGSCGQIGSELIPALQTRFPGATLIATDVRDPQETIIKSAKFKHLDILDVSHLEQLISDEKVDTIFHLAAILSAKGENNPQMAYSVNLEGFFNILEAARKLSVKSIITPSSIAVYGPDAPKNKTPDETALNPTTMYGVTKVAGEKLLQYYHLKYGLNVRALRYPGIISSQTEPGGGTTDYAVELFKYAASGKPYVCYIEMNTPLPFMYMPDAIEAIIRLSLAEENNLNRRVYNVHSMQLTPGEIVASIRKFIPEFECSYKPDYRQNIASSWPHSIDDSNARKEWGWKPQFNLPAMTADMLLKLGVSRPELNVT